jgi:hypothetical protein
MSIKASSVRLFKVLLYRAFGHISQGLIWCPWCEDLMTVDGHPRGYHFHCGMFEQSIRRSQPIQLKRFNPLAREERE